MLPIRGVHRTHGTLDGSLRERHGGKLAVRHQGETIPSRLAPPRSGVLRERRSTLAREPALERIASGLGSGGAPPGRPELSAAANGTAVNGAAPQTRTRPLHPPTPRQQARWKAIRQAQFQGLSMRATARVLGIFRVTVSAASAPAAPRAPGCGIIYRAANSEQRERTLSANC